MALIPLNTFKTKTAILTKSEYNNETCARDTGLIIDSVAFDLLYGYSSIPSEEKLTQSIFSGLQYWAQDAIKIPGDVLQTLAALDHAKEISKQIVINEPIIFSKSYPKDLLDNPIPSQIQDLNNVGSEAAQKRISEEYDLISKIIENGTKGITNLIIPNEHDVKSIANDWMPDTIYKYGTILKANIGSITAYYKVIGALFRNELNAEKSGAMSPTHLSGTAENGDLILEYIPIDETIYNAANLLLNNKELIQEEVTAYIVDTFNKNIYDKVTLEKNVKLIVDSLAFDLLFNGSSQSKFIGLQYWTKNSTTKIPNQVAETIASIKRMKEITIQIIKNESVIKSKDNLLDQYTDLSNPGNFAGITAIETLFNLIIDILENGVSTLNIISNTQLTTYAGLLNAYELIQNNKLFIQAEIIAWIDEQISNEINPFINTYPFTDSIKREKCYRDTGYIIDCISFDLIYTSTNQANRQSIQAGVYYYNNINESILTPTEQSQVITIFNYLKTLINEIVTGKTISITYQSDIKQLTKLPKATNVQSTYVLTQFDLITDIIEKGPSFVNEVEPISLIPSTDTYDMNGFRLLLANKDFLAAEAIGFINNSTSSNNFNLTGDRLLLCKRDIGYIIDSIIFDLRHGGNRQAIHSGVYYYNHSASISVIPKERIDTTEAYTYMKSVIGNVLRNIPLNITYQSKIKQLTNLESIDNNVIENIIDFTGTAITKINEIISSGTTTNIDANKVPISLVITNNSTEEIIKAFNILLANRQFITAEIIGYLNTILLKRPNTTKIYTAPPGVTAIILMAQAANVTDKDVEVTFAHYRNIPVFSDPATYNGYQAANTITELVKDFIIPSKNAASLVDGKMIVESFDSVIAYADVNEGVKITLSILETANA